jgi:hypothetical protein
MTKNKQARRERALARFHIMSAEEFAAAGREGRYTDYRERKQQEYRSLYKGNYA